MEWVDLLGPAGVAGVAARALLPRWLAALAAWLNTNPPHATVLASYTDFKVYAQLTIIILAILTTAFEDVRLGDWCSFP